MENDEEEGRGNLPQTRVLSTPIEEGPHEHELEERELEPSSSSFLYENAVPSQTVDKFVK